MSGAFSALTLVGAGPATGIGAIEAVASSGAVEVKVVVTAGDGSVHAAELVDGLGFFGFQQVTPLDLR